MVDLFLFRMLAITYLLIDHVLIYMNSLQYKSVYESLFLLQNIPISLVMLYEPPSFGHIIMSNANAFLVYSIIHFVQYRWPFSKKDWSSFVKISICYLYYAFLINKEYEAIGVILWKYGSLFQICFYLGERLLKN